MNNIALFTFESHAVRVVMIDGEPWFVAADVAEVLDYRDASNMARILDDDEKGTHIVSTLGGDQELTVINESGLYSLILTSRKPEAKKFKKWVTSEVLPSIRKTGGYTAPGAIPLDANFKQALALWIGAFAMNFEFEKNPVICSRSANNIVINTFGINILGSLGMTPENLTPYEEEYMPDQIEAPALTRAELQAVNRQAWADVSGDAYAMFHARREKLIAKRQVMAAQRRAVDRQLAFSSPSWRPVWAR